MVKHARRNKKVRRKPNRSTKVVPRKRKPKRSAKNREVRQILSKQRRDSKTKTEKKQHLRKEKAKKKKRPSLSKRATPSGVTKRVQQQRLKDFDEETLEWAEAWGVTPDEAEDMLEAVEEQDIFNPPTNRYGHPDPDYMQALAEAIGSPIDVSDLYDMYYGYPPGSRGR